jgi:hypothetical protein
MRKTLAVAVTALGLSFGSVGVANATTVPAPPSAPVVSASTTVLAADDANDDSGDNGLWGLAGLLGLLGLLGLRRRNDVHRAAGTVNTTGGNTPRM